MTTKMTNVKALEYVLNTYADLPEDVATKLTNMKISFENRAANTTSKPTAQQKANEKVKAELETVLATGEKFTATELQRHLTATMGEDFTNQRVSALLRLMRLDGKVEKLSEKGKTYFKAA